MMERLKNVSDVSPRSDEELEKFWDKHEPEDFVRMARWKFKI